MERLTVPALLKKYRNLVVSGKVQFLKSKKSQKDILSILDDFIADINKAHTRVDKDRRNNKETHFSDVIDWHETHKKGRLLWQKLISFSLFHIDPNSKGNRRLTDFLDKATKFEDLLYGLEPYYRDHTLHSLWVYFIGEFLLRELLPNLYDDLNWYLFNDIEKDQPTHKYPDALVKQSVADEKKIKKGVNKYKDAIWCLMALCHDLGYSLAKLEKLNERVKDVLDYIALPDFRHIGYSLDLEHQYLVSQFLELMAIDVRIVPSENYKDENIKVEDRVLVKCYKDDSTYWRVCRALEKKQHGILSSYLIYKILGIFAEAWVRGPGEEWGLDDEEAIDNIIRGDILFGIAQHEFDFAHLKELSSLADILLLADELEEFSRYGRQMLSRKYYDTTAHASITFSPSKPKQGDDIDIEIHYDVDKHADLLSFFGRKAERLCKIYSLEQPTDSKYCTLNSIKMVVEQRKRTFYFHLCKDPNKTRASLPGTWIDGRKYSAREYHLVCHDEIFVIAKGQELPLREWLRSNNVVM